MSLPITIIFERHWDTIPKSLIKDLLPDLNKRGYGTLCYEAPQNLSSVEIVDRQKAALELDSGINQQAEKLLRQVGITRKLSDISFSSLVDLMRLYVSSQRYVSVAEKVKQLPASQILNEVFGEAALQSMTIKGIDINNEYYDKIISINILSRFSEIESSEDHRITTMFQNLLKLRSQQEEGVIFVCGALHAKRLIDEFKKHGLQNEVLYYFPHSTSRYEESEDDIQLLMDDTLRDHTYLLAQKDIKPFGERVIRDITERTRYKTEVVGYNSHSQFLSEFFKVNFKVFFRPGHHVDALVDVAESAHTENIIQCLSAVGVQTHMTSLDRRTYLVVPNVNTEDIANKIRKISS